MRTIDPGGRRDFLPSGFRLLRSASTSIGSSLRWLTENLGRSFRSEVGFDIAPEFSNPRTKSRQGSVKITP